MSIDDQTILEWKTLSLTTVVYPRDDLYGKILALISLLPIAIIIAFFTLMIFVRDIHVIMFFIGQLLNEFINFILKKSVKEDRPEHQLRDQIGDRSYGWPSSHSQFMAFFAIYSSLLIIFRLSKLKSRWFCSLLILLNIISIIFVFHSRIYLRYHYLHQCIHGSIIGICWASIWYFLVQYIFEPLIFHYLLSSPYNRIIGLCSIYLPLKNNKSDKQS